MINLEPRHMDMLRVILQQAGVPFYAFGSRVKGTNQKFSDLDICYKEPIDRKILTKIKFDLEDSNLPIFVDIVDYNKCNDYIRAAVDKDGVLLVL